MVFKSTTNLSSEILSSIRTHKKGKAQERALLPQGEWAASHHRVALDCFGIPPVFTDAPPALSASRIPPAFVIDL